MAEIKAALTKGEEGLLAVIGFLTMRWNYAEHCARQIVRRYVPGDSIDDPEHLKLSARTAKWIEDELRDEVLPKWQEPGKGYLSCLIDAYSAARAHRNEKVHGVYAMTPGGGEFPAQAILINSMPVNGEPRAPVFVTVDDLNTLAQPFTDLGEFAQKVSVGFDRDGARAKNNDGTFVIDPLPALIVPLPAPVIKPLITPEQKQAIAAAQASKKLSP